MSEPITLYRDGDEVTVTAPSFARDLQAQGWTTEPEADDWMASMEQQAQDALADDDVPFDFAPTEDDTQEVDIVPVKAKRGRPRKAKAWNSCRHSCNLALSTMPRRNASTATSTRRRRKRGQRECSTIASLRR